MTSRDKKMIVVFIVLAIVALYYNFVYRPINNKGDALEMEIQSLQERLNEKEANIADKQKYLDEITQWDKEIAGYMNIYPNDVNEERAFKLVFDIEANFTAARFMTVGFSELTKKSPFGGGGQYETYGLDRTVNSELSMDYETFKEYMGFIGHYPTRTVMDNITLTYDEETRELTFGTVMHMYGMYNSERKDDFVELDTVPVGNLIPFKGIEESPRESVVENPDQTQ